MGIINQLSTEVSNKIAAGEVVERPASAIKELLENSIDAGASTITVEIKNGGVTYMRVADNGSGMSREDARLAFLRHATSKIEKAEDLDAIYTYGFRGEALSSIGAVSYAEIFTKRAEDEIGTHLLCEGGVIGECEDAGVPDGTSLVVSKLFYNTPARMRFLKKDAAETAAITDVVERIALSHPEISFRYIVDGKERLHTSGDNSLINCIYAVYGKAYAASMMAVNYETDMLKLTGFIGKSDIARPTRTHQSFFINRRFIKSSRFSNTLSAAYKNHLTVGKFPVAVLNLEINPSHININVHPTKLEAKMSYEDEVFRNIYYAIKGTLDANLTVPKIESVQEASAQFERDNATNKGQLSIHDKTLSPDLQTQSNNKIEDSAQDSSNSSFLCALPSREEFKSMQAKDSGILDHNPSKLGYVAQDFSTPLSELFSGSKNAPDIKEPAKTEQRPTFADIFSVELETMSPEEQERMWGFSPEQIHLIGQIFDTYAIAQAGETMLIMDQHAAHERILYEELKATLKERKVEPQELMVAIPLDLTSEEFEIFKENKDTLAALGFEAEEFGASTIAVRTTPVALAQAEVGDILLELLSKLGEHQGEVLWDKMERLLYTIACKSAVKANHRFDLVQLRNLLLSVMKLRNINTCPHGRPIIITMSKKELEKEFKRII